MKKNKNYKHFDFEGTDVYSKKVEPLNKLFNRIKKSVKNKKLKSISTTTSNQLKPKIK